MQASLGGKYVERERCSFISLFFGPHTRRERASLGQAEVQIIQSRMIFVGHILQELMFIICNLMWLSHWPHKYEYIHTWRRQKHFGQGVIFQMQKLILLQMKYLRLDPSIINDQHESSPGSPSPTPQQFSWPITIIPVTFRVVRSSIRK